MAFSGNAVCTSFKAELLTGTHNFTNTTGDGMKIALYTNTATLSATTTVYTATGEVATGGNYNATGLSLTNVTPLTSGTTAYTDFNPDPTWTAATITARGALIYNASKANRSIVVLDFGSDKSSSAGDFTVVFPAADASNAIIRIA